MHDSDDDLKLIIDEIWQGKLSAFFYKISLTLIIEFIHDIDDLYNLKWIIDEIWQGELGMSWWSLYFYDSAVSLGTVAEKVKVNTGKLKSKNWNQKIQDESKSKCGQHQRKEEWNQKKTWK